MNSSKIRLLAVAVLVLGSVATAYACGDEDKASKASASLASSEKAGCASKASVASSEKAGCASKSASASLANAEKGCCASKGTSAALASAKGADHCANGAKGAVAAGADCEYGESSVTMAGACPTKNEADYAFHVSGAECKGTGSEVARAIKSIPGVSSVTVDYENQMAYVCADSKAASKKAIQNSLKKAGYSKVKFVSQTRENCQKSHGKIEA